jgi:peptidoglycan/LPS O-acetylase OafA/YrhL
MSEAPRYRRDIDGLRAVAVSAVVVYHAFPDLLPGGFVGVDVFFVISGMLITSIVLREIDADTFSIRAFYKRRIQRLFPALAVVLLATYLIGWLFLYAKELEQLGKHLTASAFFGANFAFWRESGYFDAAAETKPLLHLWSLGIEEQFYILWPCVLLLTHRQSERLLSIAVVLFGASLAACVFTMT